MFVGLPFYLGALQILYENKIWDEKKKDIEISNGELKKYSTKKWCMYTGFTKKLYACYEGDHL